MENNFQKVLLLGNGINRAYNADSWGELINELRIGKEKSGEESIPYPLRAILVSNDNVDSKLRDIKDNPQKKHLLYGKINSTQQLDMLYEILDIGFDNILTTNYSYELESAALKKRPYIEEKDLKKAQKHTSEVTRAETKYLLHTYNEMKSDSKTNKIWHIHGEARKCNSIVLGQYYYGSLLFRYKALLDGRGNRYVTESEKLIKNSWLDSFILSDVYILGFGFDLSEFDLWWLLNRKKRENAPHGTIYYYAPENENDKGKIELLKTLGVTCYDLGYSFREKNKDVVEYSIGDEHSFYPMFYEAAIKDIAAKVNG